VPALYERFLLHGLMKGPADG
jgi:hypothetical protein